MNELAVSRLEFSMLLERLSLLESAVQERPLMLRREADIPEETVGGGGSAYLGSFAVLPSSTAGVLNVSSGFVEFIGSKSILTELKPVSVTTTEAGIVVGKFKESGAYSYITTDFDGYAQICGDMQTGETARIIASYDIVEDSITNLVQQQYGPIVVPWLEWVKTGTGSIAGRTQNHVINIKDSPSKIGLGLDWARFGQ